MSEEKPAVLPRQWPGAPIDHATALALISKLNEHQQKGSAPDIGERFAYTLLEKTPAELKEILGGMDNETGNNMTDWLFAAEKSLKARLELVDAAIARVSIASGVVPWAEPDQADGGANV